MLSEADNAALASARDALVWLGNQGVHLVDIEDRVPAHVRHELEMAGIILRRFYGDFNGPADITVHLGLMFAAGTRVLFASLEPEGQEPSPRICIVLWRNASRRYYLITTTLPPSTTFEVPHHGLPAFNPATTRALPREVTLTEAREIPMKYNFNPLATRAWHSVLDRENRN